ncbi:MAG: DUF2283 domain-containing protein [Candidatus Pacebacteria bacterium]|nr:DUF2283 domain-containing protein [Candidatus Paceibacterota bacterium]
MPKIDYDQETNIMTIKISSKKSVDSDMQKNIVVDYDKDGNIAKIEIMNIDLSEFEKKEMKLKNYVKN